MWDLHRAGLLWLSLQIFSVLKFRQHLDGEYPGVFTATDAEDDPSLDLPAAVCDGWWQLSQLRNNHWTCWNNCYIGITVSIGILDVHVKGWFKPRKKVLLRRALPYSGTSLPLPPAFSIILHFHVGIYSVVGSICTINHLIYAVNVHVSSILLFEKHSSSILFEKYSSF